MEGARANGPERPWLILDVGQNMRKLVVFFVLAAPLFGGRTVAENYKPLGGLDALSPSIHQADVLASARAADAMVVYEGLPHPFWDFGSFRKEAERDDVVWFVDIPFYTPSRPLKKEDQAIVVKFVSGAFPPDDALIPTKSCGGFHADFCVQITSSGKDMKIFFCFGCGDFLAISGDKYWLTDVSERPDLEAVEKMLSRYRSKMPTKKPNQQE